MSDDRKPLPPYMPYRTFLTFLSHLKTIGLPSHIDKSVMATMSGAMQSWLRSTLRYLLLVNEADEPTPALRDLVAADDAARKRILGGLFRQAYRFLDGQIDLKNTTPQKLRASVIALGAQGETVEKIVGFMVAMAKDADIGLSPLLTKRAPRQRRPRTKLPERVSGPNGGPDSSAVDRNDDREPTTQQMKTIELPKSGGTLTLSGSINIFELVEDERELVFSLIDKMKAFERAQEGG